MARNAKTTGIVVTSASKHNKTQSGTSHPEGHVKAIKTVSIGKDAAGFSRGRLEQFERPTGGQNVGATDTKCSQYTVAYGKGSNRKSTTKHCTEAQIEAFKEELKKAGY